MGWFRTLALAAVAAAALTGAAAAQVTYNRGNDADPETLDPHKTATVYEANILRDLYEGLLIHDGAGKVAPGVAEKHEISDDGRVYRFTLRNNAKWSNGDPVKASDFVFSFRRIMDPNTGAKYANILYPILNAEKVNKGQPGAKLEDLGVKAVDDRTVEITLERPTPYFLELLTHQSGTPVHPGSIQKHGANFTRPENMVSNGAYVLKEWVPNSHIRLQKNPQFHAAASVKIDVVRYEPTKDLSAAARRFMAGELQSTSDIPADQTKFLKEKLGDQVKISPYLGTWYLAVNTVEEAVRRRARAPGAVDRHRPRVHRRGDLAGHHAAGLFVRAARHRQLRQARDRRLQGPLADRPRGQGEGAAEGGGLRAGQAAQGRAALQYDRQQQEHRGGDRQPVEGDRRRDELHQHRCQDPLRLSARRRRFRRRPRRLDRRLLRPAELPVPRPVGQPGLQLREVQEPGLRRA